MGEDLPLDPNQVQPPQEEQVEQQHIKGEQTDVENELGDNQGEDSRVQDIEKARVMAEAGDEWREEAMLDREQAKIELPIYNSDGTIDENATSDAEQGISNLEYGASHAEKKAREAEDAAGKEYDKPPRLAPSNPNDPSIQLTTDEMQKSPGRIRNKYKAEVMADQTDSDLQGHPFHGSYSRLRNTMGDSEGRDRVEMGTQNAADDYELVAQAERQGKTPEQLEKLITSNRRAFLDYAHAVAENHAQYGDKLSPNLVVLEAVYQLGQRYPDFVKSKELSSYYTNIEIQFSKKDGFLTVKIDDNYRNSPKDQSKPKSETWHASVFDSDESNGYEITEYVDEPDFESVTTTKSRSLRADDAVRLQKRVAVAVGQGSFDPKPRHEDEDDDYISSTEIAARARARFGDTEQAREAAEKYPGDFM